MLPGLIHYVIRTDILRVIRTVTLDVTRTDALYAIRTFEFYVTRTDALHVIRTVTLRYQD